MNLVELLLVNEWMEVMVVRQAIWGCGMGATVFSVSRICVCVISNLVHEAVCVREREKKLQQNIEMQC